VLLADNNIHLFNRDGSSDLFFEIKNGATNTNIQVTNAFGTAQGAFQHMCVVVAANGDATVYRQGECRALARYVLAHWAHNTGVSIGFKASVGPIPNGVRETCVLARGADGNDANLDGSLDDFRVYSRALNEAEVRVARTVRARRSVTSPWQVQDVLCKGRPALDCVGLLGHYPFDGDARDASSNAWHGSVVASTAEVSTAFGVWWV
jgi:hypothetical protein